MTISSSRAISAIAITGVAVFLAFQLAPAQQPVAIAGGAPLVQPLATPLTAFLPKGANLWSYSTRAVIPQTGLDVYAVPAGKVLVITQVMFSHRDPGTNAAVASPIRIDSIGPNGGQLLDALSSLSLSPRQPLSFADGLGVRAAAGHTLRLVWDGDSLPFIAVNVHLHMVGYLADA